MPITLETFSGSELVSGAKVDRNFTTIEEFFIEGVKRGDFDSKGFDRYFLKKWTNGRLNSATVGSNPILDLTYYWGQAWDWIVPDFIRTSPGGWLPEASAESAQSQNRENLPYELLGFPGPSYLIYDVAEDGSPVYLKTINSLYDDDGADPAISLVAGIKSSSMPAMAPHEWFTKDECWSRWLTVPNGSMKIYVPDGCIAHVFGSFSMLPGPGTICEIVAQPTWDPYGSPIQQLIRSFKVGLFVDTNPVIKTDFPNTNGNIIDPVSGDTAPYVSFKKIQEKSIRTDLRTQDDIRGAVVLKGGSWYNISMKYKDSGTFGYVDTSDSSIFHARWADENTTLWPGAGFNAPVGSFDADDARKGSINDFFWESVQLNVEFYYGRSAISDDLSDTSNSTTPDLDY